MVAKVLNVLRKAWRVGLAGTAFLVATAKALVDLGVVNSQPHYGSWVIIGGALVVLIDSVGRIIIANTEEKDRLLHDEAMKVTLSTMKTMSELTGLSIWSLGGSVFVPKRAGFLWHRQTLDRVARQRLSDSPAATMVKWVPGKGVVGKVWQEQRLLYVSWKRVAEKYPSESLTEENFLAIPLTTRSGFTFAEFRGIVDKYAEVIAVPIWSADSKKVIGVLSIDAAMTDDHRTLGSCLSSRDAKETAERGARVLSNVVSAR